SPMNPSSSERVGICPLRSRYATSSNVEFSASVVTSYPRYDRRPACPSIRQTLERAAGTPARPGTYSAVMGFSWLSKPRKSSAFCRRHARMPGVKEKEKEAPRALPPLDFSTLILSMASTAMVQLGVVPAPGDRPVAPDLAAAPQATQLLG